MTVSVLIVEDNRERREQIIAALKTLSDAEQFTFVEAEALADAKRFLRTTAFDLLILDIAIPRQRNGEIRPNGGLELLDELDARDGFFFPNRVIGITAHQEIYERSTTEFSDRLHHLVQVDITSDRWIERVRNGAANVLAAAQGKKVASNDYATDLCVICALRDPELKAVLSLDWEWSWLREPNDDTTYHRGTFESKGVERTVTAAAAARMGMPATAVLATKMIYQFRPKFLAMVGISAGVRERTEVGDVIFGEPSWDCGSGKWRIDDGVMEFLQAPHQLDTAPDVREKFALISEDVITLAKIKSDFEGEPSASELRLRLGPLASAASVLADGVTIRRITTQRRDALGVDMETYAVMVAGRECGNPKPKTFSLKSVVDFADGSKNDRFQRYGAYTSAQVLRHAVEEILF